MLICDRPRLYDVDLIGLAALVIIGLALWYGAIQPLEGRTREFSLIQQGKLAEKEKSMRELEHLKQLNRQRQLLAEELSQVRDVLRENTGIPNMLRTIEQICRDWSLRIDQVIPGPWRQTPNFSIQAIEINLSGHFPDLIGFVETLNRQAPYVCVAHAVMESRGQAGAESESSSLGHISLAFDIFSP